MVLKIIYQKSFFFKQFFSIRSINYRIGTFNKSFNWPGLVFLSVFRNVHTLTVYKCETHYHNRLKKCILQNKWFLLQKLNKCMWENFENHKIVQHPLHEISTLVIPKQWKTLSPSSGFAIHIYELKTGIFIKKNLIYHNKNPVFQ